MDEWGRDLKNGHKEGTGTAEKAQTTLACTICHRLHCNFPGTFRCRQVKAIKLRARGPEKSPGADGIHLSAIRREGQEPVQKG